MKKLIYLFLLILTPLNLFADTNMVGNQTVEIENPDLPKPKLTLSSPAFTEKGMIPRKYTCDFYTNVNPPLTISNIPDGTKSLTLIMDDPDTTPNTFTHWVVFNISPSIKSIGENSNPGTLGRNDFIENKNKYGGPCPPIGQHRYFFKLYALDKILNLKSGSSVREILAEMDGHVLEQTELIGLYGKKTIDRKNLDPMIRH